MPRRTAAFTMIELLAALALVAIALTALLRLQLQTLRLTDRHDLATQAALLAQEKLDETIATNPLPVGRSEGAAQRAGRLFSWQTEIAPYRLPQVRPQDLADLLLVRVTVWWDRPADRRVSLTMCLTKERPS